MRRQKILFNFFLLSFLYTVEAYATTCYSAYTPSISSTQQTVCSGNTVTLSAYGNLRNNYYWSWYKDGCATIPLGNGYNKIVTPTVTTTYYARGEGGCASPGPCGQITINVIPGIAPPTATPSFQCQPGAVALQATGSTNQTIDWFNAAIGGGVISGGYNTNVFTTPFLNSSTTYYAQARDTITGCYSSNRTPVTANIGILTNNLWNSKANFPGAIQYGGVGFSLNGKGYIGTGINTSGANTDEFWEYEPITNVWTQKASFAGGPRHYAVGFGLNSKCYIGAGEGNNGAPLNDFWEYNPLTNNWIQKTNIGGAGREGCAYFTIGSKAYVGLGSNGNFGGNLVLYTDLWEYNVADNIWIKKADFPGNIRMSPVSFSIGIKGYIGTGHTGSTYSNEFWEYNPINNTWTSKPVFPGNARGGAFGFSLGNKGYIGGGTPDGGVTSYNDFWEYNPSNSSWEQLPQFNGTPRAVTNYFSINGKGYFCAGISSGGVGYSDLWEYTPAQSIQTENTNSENYCAGTSLFVHYKIAGNFGECNMNVFTAQLSDANGSFNTPVTIGTIVSNTDSVISCVIPSGTASGTGYRIRVVSSNPLLNGSDNGRNITIGTNYNSWNQKANFGGSSREASFSFSIGNKGYIGAGYDGTFKNDFWEFDPTTNVWSQKANFAGTARNQAGTFVINGKGYVGGGDDNSAYATNDFWEYNPSSNSWMQKTSIPGPPGGRVGAAGFTIGNKGYLATGYTATNNNFSYDLLEYDPANDTWAWKAPFPGAGRSWPVAFSIGTKGYVGTGANATLLFKDFWEYNSLTDTWVQKADVGNLSRTYAAGFSIGEKGYIGGGATNGGASPGLNDFWEYNPQTNQWIQKADIGGAGKNRTTGFSLNGRGYIGTGLSSGVYLNDFWEYTPTPEIKTGTISLNSWHCAGDTLAVPYTVSGIFGECVNNIFTAQLSDATGGFSNPLAIGNLISNQSGTISSLIPGGIGPGSGYRIRVISSDPSLAGTDNGKNINIGTTVNSWQQKNDFGGTGRNAAVGLGIGNFGYMGTGFDGSNFKNDWWQFNPSTNTWTQKADFGGTSRAYAASFAIAGKGYIATGLISFSGTSTNDLWEYDPVTNAWNQKATFPGSARNEATGFNIGNKGYICAGVSTTVLNDLWEYDPLNDSWRPRTTFPSTLRGGAVGFSIGNLGYFGMGGDVNGNCLNDFWAFNPSTNTWIAMATFPGVARRQAVSLSINQTGYVGTGLNGSSFYNDFWEYNSQINTWIQKTNFGGSGRKLASGFAIFNKIYIGLGSQNSGAFSDFWEYDAVPSIVTLPLSTLAYCPGDSLHINFSASGTFGLCSSNIFTAQLSDANGGFTNPVSIGTISSTTSGSIACSIPSGTITGTRYRIRVASSNIVVNGSDNGLNIFIGTSPSVWMQKSDIGGVGREKAVSFSIGSKGYVGTGIQGSNYKKDFWEYDTTSNIWTQKADFGGTGRYDAIGFSIGLKGYIGTGNDGTYIRSDFWEYDPSNNEWTQKADVGGNPRQSAFAMTINSKGYVGTGSDAGGTYYNDFWEFDPVSNNWTQKSNYPGGGRRGACAFSIGNKGYAGTGQSPNNVENNDFWEFDPVQNLWTGKNSFDGGCRYNAVGFNIGFNGYVGAGENESVMKDFWKYDPLMDSWLKLPEFPGSARIGGIGFSIGNKGYYGAGRFNNDFYSFRPEQELAINYISPTVNLCQGALLTINFIANGEFSKCTGNTFTAQLSDVNGFFNTPVSIGTVSGNSSGTIICSIPSGTISGIKYRIRLVSDNPVIVSSDNGTNLAIGTSIQDTWIEKTAFGGQGRRYAANFSINNKGYIGTGYNGNTYYNDLWEYDPVLNLWTQKANVGGSARVGAVGFSIGSKGYIGTGYSSTGSFLNDIWEYNASNNTWIQKSNFGGTARSNAVAFGIGSKGYIGTGYDGSAKKDFWEFDPISNNWIQKADFGGGFRFEAVGFSIGSLGYIGTGTHSSMYSDFWEYNPNTNSWIQKANITGLSRKSAAGFTVGMKGYIVGGIDINNNYSVDCREYDSSTDTWTQKQDFPGSGRYGCSAFSIGTKGYIGVGYDGSNKNDFYAYECGPIINTGVITSTLLCSGNNYVIPYDVAGDFGVCNLNTFTAQLSDANGSFTFSTTIGTQIINTSGTISCSIPTNIPNGTNYRIRVISSNPYRIGTDNGSNLSIGMMATNVWTQKSNFGGISRQGSVSFSIGSKGYVGTGTDAGNNNYYNDFWEFDPSTNTWTQKATFGGNARYTAVGFAIGTKGYIGTGQDATVQYNDFWEYDPTVNVWNQKSNFGGIPRGGAVGFSIGTKGYIGTGGSYLQDFWEWDQVTDTWIQKANFGGGVRNNAVGFSIGTKGYTGTGYTGGGYAQDFWEYDPYNNTWLQKTNFGGASRAYANGFSIGNKGYVGMGSNPGILSDFWEWNPNTNVWTLLANFTGSNADIGFAIGQKGYAGIGITNSGNDFWEYEPSNQVVTDSIPSINYCAGLSLNVPYTSIGTYVCSNTFSAQLSDANGSFASPVNIGSVVSTTSGAISAAIPANTPNGAGYRIRVVSSNPTVTGSDNSNNLTVSSPVISPSGALSICPGDTITLNSSSISSNYWNTGATTQSIIVDTAGTYTVNVNGCYSQPVTVIMNTAPTALITPNGPVQFCSGGSVTLTASGGSSYLWSTGETSAAIIASTNGNYMVTVSDANCSTTASQLIYVATNPDVTILASDTVICKNSPVNLTAYGAQNYLWTPGNQTTQTIIVSPDSSMAYVVTGIDSNSCVDSALQTIDVFNCTVQLNLKMFIEGYYLNGTDSMVAVVDPYYFPELCDTVTVHLADSATFAFTSTDTAPINTHGFGTYNFSNLQPGRRYYIVIKHRNTIETWSKNTYLFTSPGMFLDFTSY